MVYLENSDNLITFWVKTQLSWASNTNHDPYLTRNLSQHTHYGKYNQIDDLKLKRGNISDFAKTYEKLSNFVFFIVIS